MEPDELYAKLINELRRAKRAVRVADDSVARARLVRARVRAARAARRQSGTPSAIPSAIPSAVDRSAGAGLLG
jgi:hypothetical protein